MSNISATSKSKETILDSAVIMCVRNYKWFLIPPIIILSIIHISLNISVMVTSNVDVDDFALAKRESLDFFDDIPSSHWKLLKKKVGDMSPNYNDWYVPVLGSGASKKKDTRDNEFGYFYQNHYEPDFVCQHERRVGNLHDGGKWICDPHRITKQKECLVYSIGSNNDFSFEEYVQTDIGAHCEIHTFDFGNFAEGAKKAGVQYHQYGVGLDDPPRFKSIKTIVKELGHEGRIIDIFKIDCEGCEWETFAELFDADIVIRQIQVELHKAKNMTQKTPKFFDLTYKNGYVITHKEPNIAYGNAIEYALLKLAPEFSENIKRPDGAAPE